jgi:uncharacterized membrane protein YebE (DUF533 family)
MALSARNAITAVAGLLVVGYVARKVQQRYFSGSANQAPRLTSSPDFQPREQNPQDEHLHVSLGEFLNGKELRVG